VLKREREVESGDQFPLNITSGVRIVLSAGDKLNIVALKGGREKLQIPADGRVEN